MRTGEQTQQARASLAEELTAFSRRRRSLFYPKTDLPFPDDALRSLRTLAPPFPPELVMDLCRQALGQKALSAQPLPSQGTFHRLYRVLLADGLAVIVRFNAASSWGRDFQFYVDRWVMDLLERHGLPALRVYHVDLSRQRCAWDYEILEEARGTCLTELDDQEALIRPLLRELGRLVGRIHQIRTERFGWLDAEAHLAPPDAPATARGLFPAWRDYLLLNLSEHLQACEVSGVIQPGERRRIQAVFTALEPCLSKVSPALLHGDLGNHNVFAQAGAITALLDWEDCLSGDPVFDIAFWATFHPDARHASFLEGYRCEQPLPPDFAQRFWLYYLRVALSKTVHRQRFGYADRPGRLPASGRIHKALAKLEELA